MKNKRPKTKDLIDSLQHLSIKPANRRQNRVKSSHLLLSVLLPSSRHLQTAHRPCFSDDMMTVFSLTPREALDDDLSVFLNRSYDADPLRANRDQFYSSAGVLHTSNSPRSVVVDTEALHRRFHSSVLNENNNEEIFNTASRSFSCFTTRPPNALVAGEVAGGKKLLLSRLKSEDFERLKSVANFCPTRDLLNFKVAHRISHEKKRYKAFRPKVFGGGLTDFGKLAEAKGCGGLVTKDNESIGQQDKTWRSRRCSDPQHWYTRLSTESPDDYAVYSAEKKALATKSVLKEEETSYVIPSDSVLNPVKRIPLKNAIGKVTHDPSLPRSEQLDRSAQNDVTVNELAAYMEHSLYFPGQLSEMAQRMYL